MPNQYPSFAGLLSIEGVEKVDEIIFQFAKPIPRGRVPGRPLGTSNEI